MQSLLMKQLCYEGSHSSSPCCKNTTFSAHGTPPISIHAFRRPPRSTEHRRIELPKVRAAPPSPTFGRKRRPSKGAPPSGTSTAPTPSCPCVDALEDPTRRHTPDDPKRTPCAATRARALFPPRSIPTVFEAEASMDSPPGPRQPHRWVGPSNSPKRPPPRKK